MRFHVKHTERTRVSNPVLLAVRQSTEVKAFLKNKFIIYICALMTSRYLELLPEGRLCSDIRGLSQSLQVDAKMIRYRIFPFCHAPCVRVLVVVQCSPKVIAKDKITIPLVFATCFWEQAICERTFLSPHFFSLLHC
jgi:hypothetical protein